MRHSTRGLVRGICPRGARCCKHSVASLPPAADTQMPHVVHHPVTLFLGYSVESVDLGLICFGKTPGGMRAIAGAC